MKQVLAGILFFGVLATVAVGLLVGWRQIPGLLGEWVGIMVGIMSTPFFLEGTFFLIGIITVISLNAWRREKEGDEFVYLDEVTGPNVSPDLPDTARWALYRNPPLDGEQPSLQIQAEGALAIGDFSAAAEHVAAMPPSELSRPEILRLRLDLAQATGHVDLARRLEQELHKSRKDL